MRFMMMIKATEQTEAGVLPSEEEFAAMEKYNEQMVESGILLAGDGLQPSSKGARVSYSGSKRTVTDGPFTEAKELVAGDCLVELTSLEDAIEWAKRAPLQDGEVEIRQVFESEDFGENMTPELREQEDRLREKIASQNRS